VTTVLADLEGVSSLVSALCVWCSLELALLDTVLMLRLPLHRRVGLLPERNDLDLMTLEANFGAGGYHRALARGTHQ
jgi:hypothetical protein